MNIKKKKLLHEWWAGGSSVETFLLISTLEVDFLNRYALLYFYDGVYSSDGSSPLTVSDLTLIFTQGAGTATNCVIASLKQEDNSDLVGGEQTIRINLTVTGSPSGDETIRVTPSEQGSVVDIYGQIIDANDTSPTVNLNLGYEQEYVDVLNYALNNSISLPSASQRLVDNTLVKDSKASGAWTEWDVVYCLANCVDTGFAKINWKAPGTRNISESGASVWTA